MRKPLVLLLGSIAASAIAGAAGCGTAPSYDCNPPPSKTYTRVLSGSEACNSATGWLKKYNYPVEQQGSLLTYRSGDDICTLDASYSAAFRGANSIGTPANASDAGDAGDGGDAGDAGETDAAVQADATTSDAASNGGTLRDASPDAVADAGSDAETPVVCPAYAGSVTETCRTPTYNCGRPFEGYEPLPVGEGATEFLRSCMHLEAASVAAFEILERELGELGAPASLLDDCRKAAEDERRHARAMGAVLGESAVVPAVAPRSRTVLEIAIENACEGMIRETYGAVVGLVQAANASRADVREAFAQIAPDELEHASLSWRVGAYLDLLLSAEEGDLVRRAAWDAVANLEREIQARAAEELTRDCGVPRADLARRLVSDLKTHVWTPAFEIAA